jgi:hypothetical protein
MFGLNKIREFIKNMVPMDMVFRMKHLQAISKAFIKFCGRRVHRNGICNHLRHWGEMWVQVLKLERLEDVR